MVCSRPLFPPPTHPQHHVPKLLSMAQLGLTGAPFGAHALTDFTHRDNLAAAFLAAQAKLMGSPAERRLVAGKAYFVTDGWRCHTMEFFCPLLAGIGFSAPFPAAIVPASAVPGGESTRLSATAFAAVSKSASSSGLPGAGGDDVAIVTGEPAVNVPTWLVWPAAAIMEVRKRRSLGLGGRGVGDSGHSAAGVCVRRSDLPCAAACAAGHLLLLCHPLPPPPFPLSRSWGG